MEKAKEGCELSDSANLISSEEITNEEFYDFVLQLEGISRGPGRGVIMEGESNVWLALMDIGEVEGFYDEETLLGWSKMLCGSPKSVVEMQLDHTVLSREIYLRVAFEFGRSWPVVLSDLDGVDLPYNAVCEKYNF
ncbi:hypothetical protein K5D33_23670 [Pseudomonas cichorii]|nr:hypothetical protein [Pseudomonas cichorii]MBX8537702.1 hypothetical protein [Pseudomonas cichorii]